MSIRVQREDFDPAAELEALLAGRRDIGGVVSFIGLVRDFSDERDVGALTLEHYPGMTEKALARIEAEARERFDVQETLVVHRYGRMEPGERIVLVIAASAHRGEAFRACEFLIDWLKTRAPFWKAEETPAGPQWVEAKTEDDRATARWS
ncbi:MAG: molybdenum cofactor biosynthesis protein MoaE [Pseudomonadota bacterium]|nr:molybdenum cofactor biosynthesis protein MoaE [Pseudomonadota bacterium]